MLSTAAGIRTIDPQFILAARSMGATLPQQITRVIIPASVPTVFAGLRLGGALTIIGVVVSEMLTASAGIGYLVTLNRWTSACAPSLAPSLFCGLGLLHG